MFNLYDDARTVNYVLFFFPNKVKEPYLQFTVLPHPGFICMAAATLTGRAIREGAVPVVGL